MRKTAMVQLRDKLQEEVENIKEDAQTERYLKGVLDALQNIQDYIDAEMLAIEKIMIVSVFAGGAGIDGEISTLVSKGEDFYDELFGEVK